MGVPGSTRVATTRPARRGVPEPVVAGGHCPRLVVTGGQVDGLASQRRAHGWGVAGVERHELGARAGDDPRPGAVDAEPEGDAARC